MRRDVIEQLQQRTPNLIRLIINKPNAPEINYIHQQLRVLEVLSHIEPLDSYFSFDTFDKSIIDVRSSEVSCFVSGKVDVKNVTILGKSRARIWFGENCRVNKLLVTSNDEIANIVIGPNTEIDNAVIQIGRGAAAMIISSGSTLPSPNFLVDEKEGYLLVGDDCMFSTGVVGRTSDGHAIYDQASRKRVNHGLPIVIHNHVWVGRGVLLGKGAVVGRDAVLGQGAFVGGDLAGGNVYVGQPARLVRENTTWDRTQAETIDEAEIIPPSRVRQTNHARTCAKIDALGKESLDDLPILHAISRILAATYDDEPVRAYIAARQALGDKDGAVLCAEAHAARLIAVERDAPSWLLGYSPASITRATSPAP
jgi:acetyltransferase-like isoleucine patch superfamily enzyme